MNSDLVKTVALIIAICSSGCKSSSSSTTAADDSSTDTTSSTLTEADLDGGSTQSWMSSCLSFTPLVAGSTATYHQYVLIFSGLNYFYYDNWFNNSSCSVSSGANGELFYVSSSGTYTLGSVVSGSLYNIQMVAASGSQIYPLSYVSSGTADATWLGSSGCTAGGSYSAGTEKDVTGDDCELSQIPTSGDTINNVIEMSGGDVYIGQPSLYYAAPGVLDAALDGDKDGGATQSTPSTASIEMVKCSGSVCGVD